MKFNSENDPEQEKHYSLEIIVLSTVMGASIILAEQDVIDNATSIVISGLIILYGVYGIYRE